MKIYKVVGISHFDFTNDKGNQVEGSTYHLCSLEPEDSDRLEGHEVTTVTVMASRYDSWERAGTYVPVVGDKVLPLYTKKGSFESFFDLSLIGE